MPNGGVPIHMALKPSDGEVVLSCQGASLRVIPWDEWRERKHAGRELCRLTRAEAMVLQRFLRYWLQDDGSGPIYPWYTRTHDELSDEPRADQRPAAGDDPLTEVQAVFDY
jgi:hypothetical protein